MTFHVENIATPELRADFAAFGFKRPGSDEPATASDWIVDRDRGIFIVSLGGGMFERPNFFELATRDGVRASIEARLIAKGKAVPQGMEIWWSVSAVYIPKEHAAATSDVRRWIAEALSEFGYLGETEFTKVVHVDFLAATAAGVRS